MPSDLDLLARLLLAALLGGMIGAERELAGQPAGLRTHMLLTIGACLFTIVSAYGFGRTTDPSRLAAQIVTGIGFLGGGAILRQGLTIKGLTTAASIWAGTALGVTVGIGRYVLAFGAAAIVLATLVGLRSVRNMIKRYAASREEFVLAVAPDFDLGALINLLHREGLALRGIEQERGDGDSMRILLAAKLPARYKVQRFLELLSGLHGVYEVEWEN